MPETLPINNSPMPAALWLDNQSSRASPLPSAPLLQDQFIASGEDDQQLLSDRKSAANVLSAPSAPLNAAQNSSSSKEDAQPSKPASVGMSQNTSRLSSCAPAPATQNNTASKTAVKAKTPAGDLENRAAQYELAQQDQLRAKEIYLRMSAERQLHITKMQALLANLETEIQRIWEEVTLRRQKIHDDLLAKWEKVLFA
ncbi:MAG: hypothetical protein Q4F00_00380 [bacterium]|nr:hypothetical protein [bacterium]